MERLLTALLVLCACAGDDAGTTDPSTSTSTTTIASTTSYDETTSGTTWVENECTKQAIDCLGDESCDDCSLCDPFTSDRCKTCDGSPCTCASSLCIGAYLNDHGQDAVYAGCTACLAYCDPDDPGEAQAIPECKGILDGTKD